MNKPQPQDQPIRKIDNLDANDTKNRTSLDIDVLANAIVVKPGAVGGSFPPNRAIYAFDSAAKFTAWMEQWALGRMKRLKEIEKAKADDAR